MLLTTALHERFRTGNEDLMRVATLHGKDPALALTVWHVLTIIQSSLGGVWVLLLAITGLRLSRKSALAWLGVLVGSCGVLTLLPPLRDLGAVFGITQILWFAAVGISMLSTGKSA
ncbi:hypothetical protein [Roseateles oligotrophus]|uniref:DUF4386 family protein n=1 Tax=Roseateles oligotrophus TaxID=1769250 RepID=A0ABT2YB12_9BURK|nr:hypothetical protein [Roseateles oligotrophus]MCV2367495.1 hypothetical protein [Roseateles oligotrophus]